MAEDWELVSTQAEVIEEVNCYRARLKLPTGDHMEYVFPQAMIDIRAGEYDIDHSTPEGARQVLDIIMHEPHGDPPIELWQANNVSEARDKLLQRIELNKSKRVNVLWSGNGRAKGRMVAMARGVDPAQLLLEHRPNLEAKRGARERIERLRGEIEPRSATIPEPPTGGMNPSVKHRQQMVSLLDTPRE